MLRECPPTSQSEPNVRCTAHGPSFVSLRYYYSESYNPSSIHAFHHYTERHLMREHSLVSSSQLLYIDHIKLARKCTMYMYRFSEPHRRHKVTELYIHIWISQIAPIQQLIKIFEGGHHVPHCIHMYTCMVRKRL